MIQSAEEFVRLRCSDRVEEYWRAATEEAPLAVWYDIIQRYAEMRWWVAHNRTVPMEILSVLAHDKDHRARSRVATKNKLSDELMLLLANDKHRHVRFDIAAHKKASREVLQRLAVDRVPSIAEKARERLAETP